MLKKRELVSVHQTRDGGPGAPLSRNNGTLVTSQKTSPHWNNLKARWPGAGMKVGLLELEVVGGVSGGIPE